MKTLFRAGFLALAAAIISGCSSQPKIFYHAGDEASPDFLAGPAGVLLTNVDGFSAKFTASTSLPAGGRRLISGDFLGREGSLIFQPANPAKGKRARSEGGMFFIWNEKVHSGYVLSDPLQAYAPIFSRVQPTNLVFNTVGAAQEDANGHPCRRVEAVVQSSDGSSALFKVWEAEDARHFPVRIQTPPGPGEMTLDFSDLHLELPSAELFSPPDGFMKYETPVALMNELITRQTALSKQTQIGPIEISPAGSGPVENWRPTSPQ